MRSNKRAKAAIQVVLQVTIHDTPAALRFGGDGYFVTFAGPESDKEEAAKLILLKRVPLKITVEIDETQNSNQPERRWP